jgi:hypothetical protein
MTTKIINRIEELDLIRFIAIIFVVINHLGTREEFYYIGTISHATSPIMAFITAFLLFRSIKTSNQIFNKISKRIKTIIIPYFLWTSIYFIFIQSIRTISELMSIPLIKTNNHSDWTLNEYLLNFIVNPQPGSFWYLQNLILILPFTYVIYYIVKFKYFNLIFLPFIGLLYYFELIPYFSSRFLPYFIFGAFWGLKYPEKNIHFKLNKYLLLAVFIVLGIINELLLVFSNFIIFYLEFIFTVCMLFIGIELIRKFKDSIIVKFVRNKLSISFYLHAAHLLIILIIYRTFLIIFTYFNFNYSLIEPILPVFTFVLTFGLIDFVANFMKSKTPTLHSLLSGYR